MKFIVDRAKWYRGHGAIGSALLTEHGTRCCIGFVGQQCNVPDTDMLGRTVIDRGDGSSLKGFPRWMYHSSSAIDRVTDAYTVNDNPRCDDTVREAELKRIFEANGDEIEFVG